MLPTIIAQEIQGFFPKPQKWTHIDWLTVTLPVNRLAPLIDFIDNGWNKGCIHWTHDKGRNYYDKSLCNGHLGIRADYTEHGKGTNQGKSTVAFSGIFFNRIGNSGVKTLLSYLAGERELSCSRIDIAQNFFMKEDLLSGLCEGLRTGQYVTAGGHSYTIVEKGDNRNVSLGRTLYLGSRSSDHYTRLYDALPVHGAGAVLPHGWHWMRHETESKGKYAKLLLRELIDGISNNSHGIGDVSHFIKYTLRSYLCRHEVQVRESGDRASRRVPCLQWKKLSLMGWNSRHRLSTPPTPLEGTIKWLIHGGATKYIKALVEHSGGFDIVSQMFDTWSSSVFERGRDPVHLTNQVLGQLGVGAVVIRPLNCQNLLSAF